MNLSVTEFGMQPSIAKQNIQHHVLYRLVVKETNLWKARNTKNNFRKKNYVQWHQNINSQ